MRWRRRRKRTTNTMATHSTIPWRMLWFIAGNHIQIKIHYYVLWLWFMSMFNGQSVLVSTISFSLSHLIFILHRPLDSPNPIVHCLVCANTIARLGMSLCSAYTQMTQWTNVANERSDAIERWKSTASWKLVAPSIIFARFVRHMHVHYYYHKIINRMQSLLPVDHCVCLHHSNPFKFKSVLMKQIE